MYNFPKMQKEMAYNSVIPHPSCFCEVCQNAPLLEKGVNSSLKSSDILSPTVHDLVEIHTCNSSSKDFVLGSCPECLNPGLSFSDLKTDVDLIFFLLWELVGKKIVKLNQTMAFGQVIPKWMEIIKRHIYWKREQVSSYNKQRNELKTGEAFIHVDYSESYNNTQQYEIQSAYFGQQNFIIFTFCSNYHEAKQGKNSYGSD